MNDATQEFISLIRQMTKPQLERFADECRRIAPDMADALEALGEAVD